jgi:hypothetical protein
MPNTKLWNNYGGLPKCCNCCYKKNIDGKEINKALSLIKTYGGKELAIKVTVEIDLN